MKNYSAEKMVERFLKSRIIEDWQHGELLIFFRNIDIRTMNHVDKQRLRLLLDRKLINLFDRYSSAKFSQPHTLEHYKILHGDDIGQQLYCERNKNLSVVLKKHSATERFLKRKKESIIVPITPNIVNELSLAFNYLDANYSCSKQYEVTKTLIAFINNNLTDYVDRLIKLRDLPDGILESFIIRYGAVAGLQLYKETNFKKRTSLKNTLEYWINKGYDEHMAKIKQSEIQTIYSKKSSAKIKGKTGTTCRSVKFWVDKGFSTSESNARVYSIQSTGSLENFKKRHGEEKGFKLWKMRQVKWQTTLNNNPNIVDIKRRRFLKFGQASAESLVYFNPLNDFCKNIQINTFLGINDNSEYFIHNNKKMYFYDFTCPSIKLMIEYHGYPWHINPNIMTEEQLRDWKNPFQLEVTAEMQIAADTHKENVARGAGFDYHIIWPNQDVHDTVEYFKKIISDKLNQ